MLWKILAGAMPILLKIVKKRHLFDDRVGIFKFFW